MNRVFCALLCLGALFAHASQAPPPTTAKAGGPGEIVPAGQDDDPVTVGPLPVVQDQPQHSVSFAPQPQDEEDPTRGLSGKGAAEEEEPESLAGTLLRTLLVLGMVIALVYVSLNYGLRKLMGVRAVPGGAGLVTVVERVPVDAKRSLFVVKAAGEYLLVGGADQGMTLIAKLNSEEVARLQAEQKRPQASGSPFLMKLLSRKGNPPPPG